MNARKGNPERAPAKNADAVTGAWSFLPFTSGGSADALPLAGPGSRRGLAAWAGGGIRRRLDGFFGRFCFLGVRLKGYGADQ